MSINKIIITINKTIDNIKNSLFEAISSEIATSDLISRKIKSFEINPLFNQDSSKGKIIVLFNKNVKGKKFINDKNNKHDGNEGHWLEKLMELKINCNNKPDLFGYEMKKQSKKISFGDWSADEYLFSKTKEKLIKINTFDINMTKEEFIKTFGNKNNNYEERYSWSGTCIPKYGKWNKCGQKLEIDKDNNILALYCNAYDERSIKINDELTKNKICIAIWHHNKMKKHVEDKFNQNGFFICKKNKNGEYDKICFGKPINYDTFIENIKLNNIIFDSGMFYDKVKPNNRLYQQWRANENFFNLLIIEEH